MTEQFNQPHHRHSDPPEARLLRYQMVERQLKSRDISSKDVLEAMEKVPRHLFGVFSSLNEAYADAAYPIQQRQTISQPYIVAYMTQALDIQPEHKILEVGTGSGYQTAVLCQLAEDIFSMERHKILSYEAQKLLSALGCNNARLIVGDGSKGLPDEAPFDRILVTAAASQYPEALIDQLSPNGGIMVFPMDVSPGNQDLLKVIRTDAHHTQTINLGPVRFVPLVNDKP